MNPYVILLGLFVVAGIAVTFWGWRIMVKGRDAKAWPSVEGVVETFTPASELGTEQGRWPFRIQRRNIPWAPKCLYFIIPKKSRTPHWNPAVNGTIGLFLRPALSLRCSERYCYCSVPKPVHRKLALKA